MRYIATSNHPRAQFAASDVLDHRFGPNPRGRNRAFHHHHHHHRLLASHISSDFIASKGGNVVSFSNTLWVCKYHGAIVVSASGVDGAPRIVRELPPAQIEARGGTRPPGPCGKSSARAPSPIELWSVKSPATSSTPLKVEIMRAMTLKAGALMLKMKGNHQ